MPVQPPQLPSILLAVERQLSPRLESLLRTDAALDGIAVANGVSRLVSGGLRDLGTQVIEAVGLPSGRQVRRLQSSLDAVATELANDRTPASIDPRATTVTR